jgi:hypothetical protein
MTRSTKIRLAGLMTAAVLLLLAVGPIAGAGATIGVDHFDFEVTGPNGEPSLGAGAHPFQVSTRVAVTTFEQEGKTLPVQSPKDILVDLPQGLTGNPTAVEACPEQSLEESGNCPIGSQVGYAVLNSPSTGLPPWNFPLYNMVTAPGAPAEFGFYPVGLPVHLRAKVRTGEGYGVQVGVIGLPQTLPWTETSIILWGIPSDSRHDEYRGSCLGLFGPFGMSCPTSAPRLPFLSNPPSCSAPATASVEVNSWVDLGFTKVSDTIEPSGAPVGFEECDAVPFQPSATVAPGSSEAGAPTPLGVRIDVPQQGENPAGIESAHVKDVEVSLPAGMTVNAAAADGLAGCSPAQIELSGPEPATCPASSKLGTVKLTTPLLDEPLEGAVYQATQGANPFNTLMALYIAVADPRTGIVLKLPGKVSLDPATGRVTTTFSDNPQLPFESLELNLKGGSRAPLVLPQACGSYEAVTRITSWARPTESVARTSKFTVSGNCGAAGQFSPGLEAGTTNPAAGAPSPFTLRVTRPDGQQNISQIKVSLPEGLLAKLAGVALCPDAAAASGSCPAASQVGTATVGAGSGTTPVFVPQPGRAPAAVYLAGPYKGAPYSLVVKVPAQAGPFDLGTVTVRNALRVDPTTTAVTVESDPLPQILEGVPVTYRDVRVDVDRADFTRNPTSCGPSRVTSVLTSSVGRVAAPSTPFAVADCEALAFEPKLALKLKGALGRTGHPALTAVLTQPEGANADVAGTTVILPKAFFIDQGHVKNPCTRVQFAANACPAASVLGTAVAYTPLLDRPLEGPVYFRSNGGERRLPDLVADLNGQIHVTLVGFIDSKKVGKEGSRVRTRFASVPDAPVSRFVLRLKGGRRGLIQNSQDLCRSRPAARVQMTGQNGKAHDFTQRLSLSCRGKKGRRSGGKQER